MVPMDKTSSTANVAELPHVAETPDYWHALIDEEPAAAFLGLKVRTVQAYRQRGGGPQFIRLSSRCVRYRRLDLRAWAEDRARRNTIEAPAA